jgi:hypothetical protein
MPNWPSSSPHELMTAPAAATNNLFVWQCLFDPSEYELALRRPLGAIELIRGNAGLYVLVVGPVAPWDG